GDPLRGRTEDVRFVAQQFMQRSARKHGVRVTGISPNCQAALQAHNWPGNVRELQNVIERAVILCGDGEDLQAANLGFSPAGQSVASAAGPSAGASPAAIAPPSADSLVPLE